MKKKALRKDFFVEIKKTFSRFISIFFIVALGVAFFTGIRSAKPDMKLSADEFYDQSNLMDIRILGTLGLTAEDVLSLENTKGVDRVEGAYSADVICMNDSNEIVVKVMSYPADINKVVIKEGRAPEKPEECIVDTAFLENTTYKIGDKIALKSGTEDEISDTLKYDAYTITGSCTTSYYMGITRGTTSMGAGEINSFIMLPKESFDLETFTEIYLTAEGAKQLTSYTDSYNDLIENVTKTIKSEVKDVRIKARYDEVIGEANDKLNEAKEKLAKEEKKAKDKLGDARKELDEAEKEIEDGKKEITDNEKKLKDSGQKLQTSEQDLVNGKKELNNGKAKLEKSQKEVADAQKQYEAGHKEYLMNKEKITAGRAELEGAKEQLEFIADEVQREETEAVLTEQEKIIVSGEAELRKAELTLNATKAQLDAAEKEITAAEKKLEVSEKTIRDGEREIANAKIKLADGQKKLDSAKADIADAEKELKKGTKTYNKSKKEAEEKIADANEEIHDAEKEIKKIKKPKWYVLDRNSIQTYVEYSQDADRIGAIGEVFPAIFFLVAALVSLTTMTRMVEEQRTQIGTLKALGYHKFSIAAKYLLYALLATLGGSIAGGLIGGTYLPYIIIRTYQIMYKNLEVIVTPINWFNFTLATALAVFCVTAATLISCYKELAAPPAELMRPAPPKQGKRVMLERAGFIWKHLSFTWKSTVRNLVRYKKRFLMTIFGISGCMALLLVGFGIKDSIFSIVTLQFGQIFKYDSIASIDEDATIEETAELENYISQTDEITNHEYAMKKTLDAGKGEVEKSVSLTVFKNPSHIKDYVVFRDRLSHKEYTLDDERAIITEKLARLLGVKAGDSIYLKDEDMNKVTVKVSAITENYVQHYVYMTPALYEKLYKMPMAVNEMYLMDKGDTEESEISLSEKLLKNDAVTGIVFLRAMQAHFDDMLDSLDIVIVILILSAGGLAFVVLYNLNNINITERVRELATIKVLGFHDIEVSEYVFRENIALTVIGAFFGVIFGALLHRFVILTVEVDMTMFGRQIELSSYFKSILITFIFAALINFTMHFKLKRIDMAASLKSVE